MVIQKVKNSEVAIIKEGSTLNSVQDFIDILGNARYLGAEKLIIQKKVLNQDFFDLKTGIAGEVLQKFSNYQMQLAIVGDFINIKSKSLAAFIIESNRSGQIIFVNSINEALYRFKK